MTAVATLDGGFQDPAQQSARAFRAALSTLARPGRIEPIEGATAPAPCSPAAATLIVTLCDQTTPLHLAPSHDSEELRAWIAFHTGAPIVPLEEASFALGTWEALQPLSRVKIGTAEYPDRSTTVIVEVDDLRQSGAILRGPGIKDTAQLSLPEIAVFQTNRAQFPLGFDCYFTCDSRLAGLPRSTHVSEG